MPKCSIYSMLEIWRRERRDDGDMLQNLGFSRRDFIVVKINFILIYAVGPNQLKYILSTRR